MKDDGARMITEICKAENCTGCMACMNKCPRDAISQAQNERGFYVPKIDESKCVGCGLCRQVCPANHPAECNGTPAVFACWNADETVRHYSTSGGMFTLFGEDILSRGGIVFGVVFDAETGIVRHQAAETAEELRAMVGSKYVQSSVGNTYRMVKEAVDAGRPVLFVGTPCQCAGLKNFLGGQPENLFLIDIVCHGVPSPLVLKAYLSAVGSGSRVKEIRFREKNPSWKIYSMKLTFDGRDEYLSDRYTDAYQRLFLANYDLNRCCYSCRYAGVSRCGDVTLGDFWGYLSESRKLRDDDRGINLVLVNSPKGKAMIENVTPKAVCAGKTLEEAVAGNQNLSVPQSMHAESDLFWKEFLENRDLDSLTALKQPPKRRSIINRISFLASRYYFLMPAGLKKKYREVVYRNAERKRNKAKQ